LIREGIESVRKKRKGILNHVLKNKRGMVRATKGKGGTRRVEQDILLGSVYGVEAFERSERVNIKWKDAEVSREWKKLANVCARALMKAIPGGKECVQRLRWKGAGGGRKKDRKRYRKNIL